MDISLSEAQEVGEKEIIQVKHIIMFVKNLIMKLTWNLIMSYLCLRGIKRIQP